MLPVCLFACLPTDNLTAIERGMGTHVTRVIWLRGTDGLDDYNFVRSPVHFPEMPIYKLLTSTYRLYISVLSSTIPL